MVSGPLTGYSFTTEGTTKKYSAQIADASYPVLGHVVYYLTQLQKGVPVEAYLDRDGRISKIVSAPPASKKSATPVRTPEEIAKERDAYNAQAKAADEARNQERKKAELAKMAADAANAEKLKASGFGNPTPGPAPTPNGNPICAECQKTKVESVRGRVCTELGVPCNQISKERCQVEIETEKREKAAAAQEQKETPCTSPKAPVATPDLEHINREARAYPERMWVENEARMAVQPVTVVPAGFAVPKSYSSDEMILLRNVIAKDCTEPEFKMMMYMAGQYGLDPLLKQIWAVKRGEKSPAIIFVGRDGMLAIAHRSGQFDGMHSGVNYERDASGKEHPVSAWCEIWRKDMSHPFKTEVRFDEYEQPIPFSGKPGLWQTKPSVMIIKVAESVCLRKAFVVSGVYDPDEIGGA